MTNLRTAIGWLLAHGLEDDAEVWAVSKSVMEPVIDALPVSSDTWLRTGSVWQEPTPLPLQWSGFYARLMEWYSAGGTFRWAQYPNLTYRGSYVVSPHSAVFLIFLSPEIELVQSHSELMEQRKQQAKSLTQEIQEQWPR